MGFVLVRKQHNCCVVILNSEDREPKVFGAILRVMARLLFSGAKCAVRCKMDRIAENTANFVSLNMEIKLDIK